MGHNSDVDLGARLLETHTTRYIVGVLVHGFSGSPCEVVEVVMRH